jgi:hypothetical protein
VNATAAPDRYALVGHPVSHSWSPFIHGLFARATQQNMQYRLIDVPPERFRAEALQVFVDGGEGLNVTVPHKQAAAELVNELTPRASEAGAVNTIYQRSSGELVGDNTDGIGLVTDFVMNLGIAIEGRRILILGAGGATRGVLGPLLARQPALLGAAFGSTADGELAWARKLLHLLDESMLVLMDRGFDGGDFLAEVAATGAQFLVRLNATRRPPVLGRLPDGSVLSVIGGVKVRIIEASVTVTCHDGTRYGGSYRLATTLPDHRAYPAQALTCLYHERWVRHEVAWSEWNSQKEDRLMSMSVT